MSNKELAEKPVSVQTQNNSKEFASSRPLMTPEQCAAFLQVEVNTLYVMKSQGSIPYRKVGNRLRFDLSEIIEWTKRRAKE
jgi:excisionase family DNA binding protein